MKIKILHIIETLGRGGAEKRLLNDLRLLDKIIFSNVVCHIFNDSELKDEILAIDIPVYSLQLKNPYEFNKALAGLINIVKKHKPDLIHTQLFAADIYGRIIGKLFGLPVVSTVQSSVYEPGIEYFRSPARQLLDSLTGRLCNAKFIAVSEFVKTSAIKRLGFKEEDIEVIYNYIDENTLSNRGDRYTLRRSLGLSENDVALITVGKLNPPKGHSYLLEATAGVVRIGLPVKLFIVGNGQYKESLLELSTKLALHDCVIFLGKRTDVAELLISSDIFVFPSLSEGLPLSVLEAMFMAKPCIAFNLGPMPEVIEDGKTGLLVEPKNSQAFSEAILSLINDRQKSIRLGNAGRESVIKKFGAKENTEKLMRLYERMAG